MKITIITACSRAENLPLLKKSINFDCDWIIVYDTDDFVNNYSESWILELSTAGGIAGNKQKNMGLDHVKKGWVYFLDDDNVVHPDFHKLVKTLPGLVNVWGIVFSQQCESSVRKINRAKIKTGLIDQAQYLLTADLIANSRFNDTYEHDGHFVEQLHAKHPLSFLVLNNVYCYYNYLKWGK